MTDVIEGQAVEIPAERAVAVVSQPGQALVAEVADPAGMVAVASKLATVLKDIVERQKLYANIQGKKYPTVEAWQTIARLDNVVAREARPAERREDGSWEAFAELLRLSDGMIVGSSSAMCGDAGDRPWNTRADYQKRSMAQTRAISRAFRAQYSWIMALAGYEPTPSEEMPGSGDAANEADDHTSTPAHTAPAATSSRGGSGPRIWSGPVSKGSAPVDGQLRQTPEGSAFGFVVTVDGKRHQALALGPLADALHLACADGLPAEAEIDGELEMVPWEKDGKQMPPFRRVILSRVVTPEWTIPAENVPTPAPARTEQDELDALAW